MPGPWSGMVASWMWGVAVDMTIISILGHDVQFWWVLFIRLMFWPSFYISILTAAQAHCPLASVENVIVSPPPRQV